MKLQIKGKTFIATIQGEVYFSNELTEEQEVTLRSLNVTEEQVLAIFNPTLPLIVQHNKEVKELGDRVLETGLFEMKGGAYYRIGLPYTVPKLLLDKYLQYVEEGTDTTPLDNFWTKCCLNPSVDARENLFWFLQKWGFTITNKGYIVSYRNVDVKKEGNRKLHDFVALNYTKIKGQKKAPKHYNVYQADDDSYLLVKTDTDNHSAEIVGNLQELYDNLSSYSETVYTDNYTKTFKIVLGKPVSMPRVECDQTSKDCSKGLHQGAAGWLKQNYCGGVGLVCLVNPMDIVSIPKQDNYGKVRCCQYLPYGLVEWDDNRDIIPVAHELFEDDYEVMAIETINKMLQEVDVNNQVIHTLGSISISMQVFEGIDKYKRDILDKVVNIYDYDEEIEDDDYEFEDDYYDEEE